MTYPSIGSRGYSYTAFQQAQGDNSFPGTNMDADFDALHNWADETEAFLRAGHASDGSLLAGSVNRAALSSEIQIGISNPAPWATARSYTAGTSAVTQANSIYVCAVTHESGVFATDLAAAKWTLVMTFTVPADPPDDSVTTAKIVNSAVTGGKLADGSVTNAKVADATFTAAKMSATVGLTPVGGEIDYAGHTPPAGWLLCYGQAVSRVTYASLFAALARSLEATRTLSSTTLAVSTDLRGTGLVGAVIEGTGVPSGATITAIAAGTVTISSGATSAGTGQVRIYPYGAGDGSTTFNVPDRRGRVVVGRDDMGGVAAARVAATMDGTRLGLSGGTERVALTIGELPAHSHSLTMSPHTHTLTDPGHVHSILPEGAGTSGGAGNFLTGAVSDAAYGDLDTASATTGITMASTTPTGTIGETGNSQSHNNTQPSGVANRIIFAGA